MNYEYKYTKTQSISDQIKSSKETIHILIIWFPNQI